METGIRGSRVRVSFRDDDQRTHSKIYIGYVYVYIHIGKNVFTIIKFMSISYKKYNVLQRFQK